MARQVRLFPWDAENDHHIFLNTHTGRYECQVCARSWTREPNDGYCMGLCRYDYATWGIHDLVTKSQLGILGYKTGDKFLPPPVGYWDRKKNAIGLLYDPAQAIKNEKTIALKHRVTMGVNRIDWPKAWLFQLDWFKHGYIGNNNDETTQGDSEWYHWNRVDGDGRMRMEQEILAMAAAVVFAPGADFGETIPLLTPPMTIRRYYPEWLTPEQREDVRWILGAYVLWKVSEEDSHECAV
jgi:hypothetical protein